MNTDARGQTLVRYVHSLPGFMIGEAATATVYEHMGATIADAMLQAGVRYETVVRPRAERLRSRYPEARTTSGFAGLLEAVDPSRLLDWPRPGKPARVVGITQFFQGEGVETEVDLRDWLLEPRSVRKLRYLRGVGDRRAAYFKVLVGLPEHATDRHLVAFLGAAGISVGCYRETQIVVHSAADLLGVDSALFSHSIWRYIASGQARTTISACWW